MTGLADRLPRVIILIDLLDLRSQVRRMGGALGDDLTAVVRRVEAGLAALTGKGSGAPPPGTVYVYSPSARDGLRDAERFVLRQSGAGITRECRACDRRPCTHCRAGTKDPGGRGRDNPIATDLLELARDDAYDWAVVISTDILLIPVVRFLQSHERTIIHGCFPPVAADLSKACWASIDLRGPVTGG